MDHPRKVQSGFNPLILSLQDERDMRRFMASLHIDPVGIDIMVPKTRSLVIRLDNVDYRAALILKQELLSLGGDCANHRGVLDGTENKSSVLLIATRRQFELLPDKLKRQPFGLKYLSLELAGALGKYFRKKEPIWKIRDRVLALDRTSVMGILNVTPDSFSDGGKYFDPEDAVERGMQIAAEGADILDIGGESTRPGAEQPSTEEEIRRVAPVISALVKRLSIPISIDGRRPEVLEAALAAGASIVNDVSALDNPERKAPLICEYGAGLVLMHMQGKPETMQDAPRYDSVNADIIRFLQERVNKSCIAGIPIESIVVDPGIGFGKTLEHNLQILKCLSEYRVLGRPVLIGVSRKSFIGKTLDRPVDQRWIGAAAATVLAVSRGANIIRAHDVKETVELVRMTDVIIRQPVPTLNV